MVSVYEENELCAHIARLGVCLEPAACNMRHNIMNVKAADFTPSWLQQDNDGGDEMPMEDEFEDRGASQHVTDVFKEMGLEGEFNQEIGDLFVKQFENCECCGGHINMCAGEACEHLGVCYCVSQFSQLEE